jgi:tetratricopeptide (TPR) repeat protein/TolB-like protein
LAVLNLESDGKISGSLLVSLSDQLRQGFSKTQSFDLIERENMDKILQEQSLIVSDCVEEKCLVKVGHLLCVDKLVAGRIELVGQNYAISIRVIDVETGKIEKITGFQYSGSTGGLFERIEKVAGEFSELPSVFAPKVETKDEGVSFVRVWGLAEIAGQKLDVVREKAVASALREAVRQSLGVYVRAKTVAKEGEGIQDQIYSRARGYIRSYEIISETIEKDVLKVLIEAKVATGKISEELSNLGLKSQPAKPRPARILVMVDEFIDDKKQEFSQTESLLISTLTKADYRVVDREQSQRIKSTVSLSQLSQGNLPPAISSFDADLLLVGKVDSQLAADKGLGGFISYISNIELRLIRIDNGSTLAGYTGEGKGLDVTHKTSARMANDSAGTLAMENIIPQIGGLMAKEKNLEIRVAGLQSLEVLKRLESFLEGLPETESLSPVFVSPELTRLEINIPELSARELADRIAASGDLPFRISQVSASLIELGFNPSAAVRPGIYIPDFQNLTGETALKWVGKSLPEVIRGELSNSKYLKAGKILLPGDREVQALGTVPDQKKLGPQLGVGFVMSGKIEKFGKDYRMSIEVWNPALDKMFFANQVFGSIDRLTDLSHQLAWKIDRGIYAQLFPGLSLDDYDSPFLSAPPKAGPGKPAPRLNIAEINLNNIFPSGISFYSRNPFGRIVLKNPGEREISGLKVELNIPRYMDLPAQVMVEKLGPGSRKEIPFKVVLNDKEILQVEENLPVQAQIRIAYLSGSEPVEDIIIRPLMIYGRNAIDWSNSKSVGGFVTPRDEIVQGFVREALNLEVGEDQEADLLRNPIMVFSALGELPVKYLSDPSNPYGEHQLDNVQYPRETLSRRAGDCDDLSTLAASCLESFGISTALITSPGHIFLGFDTGMPAELAEEISYDKKMFFLREGKVWIPIEATKIGSGFKAAWEAGAEELNRWRPENKIEIIPLKEAWKDYPPISLGSRKVEARFPDLARFRERYARDLSAMKAGREKNFEGLLAELDRTIQASPNNLDPVNRKGVLNAREGHLEEAVGSFEQGLKIDPKNAAIRNNLGNTYCLLGELDKAVNEYQEALRQGKGNSNDVEMNLGVSYYLKGDGQKAVDTFQKVMEKGGDAPFADLDLVGAEASGGRGAGKDNLVRVCKEGLKQLVATARENIKGRKKIILHNTDSAVGGVRGKDPKALVKLKTLFHWR